MAFDSPELAYSMSVGIAGVRCTVRSNSVAALEAVRRWEIPAASTAELTIRVAVEAIAPEMAPTQFRGMEHLVVARYGENSFFFDLLRQSVDARLSSAVASDERFWAQRFLPLIFGVMGCSVGVLPLHSGCLVRDGRGILLAGASMAGKSTLTVALAQQGYEFLSDDWTYVQRKRTELVAHGLDAPVKLLADAGNHFSALAGREAGATANGEIGFELSPTADLGLACAQRCSLMTLLFIERLSGGKTHLVRVPHDYVLRYIQNSVERLPFVLQHIRMQRKSLIHAVAQLPAWRFRYAGTPQHGASQLARFVEKTQEVPR